jgi:hypothetical protein
MFDAVEGVLRDNAGRPWFAFNPRYDPGPPPEPKPEAEPKPEEGPAYSRNEVSPAI